MPGPTPSRAGRGLPGHGATGRELADEAVRTVAAAYPYHSLWHLAWTPHASLRAHHGWSHQYNTVLAEVLAALGFEVRLVHAARVRGFGFPWWLSGHSWVKVSLGGRWLDACASSLGSRAGAPPFVPVTAELPLRAVTRWAVGAALVPFVVVEAWRAWLGRRPVAGWVYHERVNPAAGAA
ncbi:arylamine N-acetyltransferase [Tessaracoccus sp. HDW20]|uniref:hypothetical protein n=1 Tax=Tessaracoccus coleopterorum TaxID=2714950 RepID=UPI0018D3B018|nr:hypothetical protein [Tessaracoccus coleopterorum]NHB84063.1 arylamine N-acetyltransferase [Tessaracoccus coleopterorum]